MTDRRPSARTSAAATPARRGTGSLAGLVGRTLLVAGFAGTAWLLSSAAAHAADSQHDLTGAIGTVTAPVESLLLPVNAAVSAPLNAPVSAPLNAAVNGPVSPAGPTAALDRPQGTDSLLGDVLDEASGLTGSPRPARTPGIARPVARPGRAARVVDAVTRHAAPSATTVSAPAVPSTMDAGTVITALPQILGSLLTPEPTTAGTASGSRAPGVLGIPVVTSVLELPTRTGLLDPLHLLVGGRLTSSGLGLIATMTRLTGLVPAADALGAHLMALVHAPSTPQRAHPSTPATPTGTAGTVIARAVHASQARTLSAPVTRPSLVHGRISFSGARQAPELPRPAPFPAYPGPGTTGVSTTASGPHQVGGGCAVAPASLAGARSDGHRPRHAATVVARWLITEAPTFSPD